MRKTCDEPQLAFAGHEQVLTLIKVYEGCMSCHLVHKALIRVESYVLHVDIYFS